jgi:hypothetical protein
MTASYYLAHFKKAGAAELARELGHTNANLVFQHYFQLVKPTDGKRYWDIVPENGPAKIVRLTKAASREQSPGDRASMFGPQKLIKNAKYSPSRPVRMGRVFPMRCRVFPRI